jgi:hypothetical protein
MIKYYARQVEDELQDSYLFFHATNKDTGEYELVFEDEYYTNETILYGNDDLMGITTKEFNRLLNFDKENYYDFQCFFDKGYNKSFDNLTQAIEWYFTRENGKRYNTREIHKWKLFLGKYFENYDLSDEMICEALELMTCKKWREIEIKGCSQSDYQYGYVSDQVSDEMVKYLELCYFNLGREYRVYESKEDFDNRENGYSIYVDTFGYKENLIEALGCEESEIEIYDFIGYKHISQYEKAN